MNQKRIPMLLLLLLPLSAAIPAAGQEEKVHYKLGLTLGEKEKRQSEKERMIDEDVLNAATDAFLTAKRFKLVERNQLGTIFTEKSLQDFIGGQVNNKLTDVLALDLVGIVGHTVEPIRSASGQSSLKWIIDVRLIDVKTASLLTTITSDRATVESLLPPTTPRDAGALLAGSIRDAFPPIGYVVQVAGKEIMVDLGTEAGLKEGDTLEMIQEGEQIIHPVTGQVMSAPLKVVGELKVESVSPQVAICRRKSKQDPQPGTPVRLKGSTSKVIEWIKKVPRVTKHILKQ